MWRVQLSPNFLKLALQGHKTKVRSLVYAYMLWCIFRAVYERPLCLHLMDTLL